jgi:hypothetical protein
VIGNESSSIGPVGFGPKMSPRFLGNHSTAHGPVLHVTRFRDTLAEQQDHFRRSIRYTAGMPELRMEISDLCQQLATITDQDVADSAAVIAGLYRRERSAIMGLAAVDAMVTGGPNASAENDARLVRVQERLRDRLQTLLAWARKTRI